MSKRAGLRDSTIKLVAGAPEDIPADGNYLRISKALYPLIVEVGGNDVYRLEPGQDVTYPIDEGFTRIRVTTTAPIDDLVTITIGNNVKVGSVVIAGQVSIAGNLNGINSAVRAVDDGQVYGASYRSIALLAANTPEVIFTPAANANGAIIHSAQFIEVINVAPYAANGAFLAKNAAPVSVTDGDAILSGDNVTTGASWQSVGGSLKKAIKIPAGKGLYYISSQAQNTFASRSVLYTLL
jgi:hypothetical protein